MSETKLGVKSCKYMTIVNKYLVRRQPDHNPTYLLEVFGDSLRLEMPCLLAVDSDNTSLGLLIPDKIQSCALTMAILAC